MLKKPLFLCLLAALIFQGRLTSTRACQYCRLAATDPEAARMAAAIHGRNGGSFPLDATLNQFQGITPSATLSVAPQLDNITTNPADLPPAVSRLTAPRLVSQPVPASSPRSVPPPVYASASAIVAPTRSATGADAGLIGLASAGGWFLWRTRRVAGPVS